MQSLLDYLVHRRALMAESLLPEPGDSDRSGSETHDISYDDGSASAARQRG